MKKAKAVKVGDQIRRKKERKRGVGEEGGEEDNVVMGETCKVSMQELSLLDFADDRRRRCQFFNAKLHQTVYQRQMGRLKSNQEVRISVAKCIYMVNRLELFTTANSK